jgi:hypothetical protein
VKLCVCQAWKALQSGCVHIGKLNWTWKSIDLVLEGVTQRASENLKSEIHREELI